MPSAFLLSATQSNSGKTTIAMALMATLTRKRLTVQPYKVGPDYIDPMYHKEATGRISRNLDSFMLSEETITYLFHKHLLDADVGIVEGVMGLFDGKGGIAKEGSSAHIAEILDLPVVLIVNGNGMSLSVAALINGFRDFSPTTKIGGVILNEVKNDGNYHLLKEIIEERCRLPVFGYLPKDPTFTLRDRHLGLYCSNEIKDLKEKIDCLVRAVEAHIDLDALVAATTVKRQTPKPPPLPQPLPRRVRIGIARDEAFNFYYQDSLDLLTDLGADLIPCSPLRDLRLPPGVSGLYLGGGYPELYLEELSANTPFREFLLNALNTGLVCYAECGGLIYLGNSLTYRGTTAPLTGFFPFDFTMTDRLQRFGYMEATIAPGTIFTPDDKALAIRGHEFHYTKRSDNIDFPHVYTVAKQRRNTVTRWEEGYASHRVVGGYPHFHFYSEPTAAINFLRSAAGERKSS